MDAASFDDVPAFDWAAPLRTEELLKAAPKTTAVKGMFFKQVVSLIEAQTGRALRSEKFSSFRDYPLSQWLPLLAEAGEVLCPEEPREGIRRVAYPTFAEFRKSLIGRIIFGSVDFETALGLVSNAYRRTNATARCSLSVLQPGRAVLAYRSVFDYPCWTVGMLEGAMRTFRITGGQVKFRPIIVGDFDCEVVWPISQSAAT